VILVDHYLIKKISAKKVIFAEHPGEEK